MRWHTANRRRLRRQPRRAVWDVKTFSKAFFLGWDDFLADETIDFDKPPPERAMAPFIRVPKATLSYVNPLTRHKPMLIDEPDEPLIPTMIKRVPTFRHEEIDHWSPDIPWDPTRYRKD